MGAFDPDVDAVHALAIMSSLGQVMTYTGAAGPVSARAYIERADDFIGDGARFSDAQWIASILVADVSSTRRGDFLTDTAAQTWVLEHKLPATCDQIEDWEVKKK